MPLITHSLLKDTSNNFYSPTFPGISSNSRLKKLVMDRHSINQLVAEIRSQMALHLDHDTRLPSRTSPPYARVLPCPHHPSVDTLSGRALVAVCRLPHSARGREVTGAWPAPRAGSDRPALCQGRRPGARHADPMTAADGSRDWQRRDHDWRI